MQFRKTVVAVGLVTTTVAILPYIPPQKLTFVFKDGKVVEIRRANPQEPARDAERSHVRHAVGSRTVVSTDSNTMIGGIVVADNTDLTAGAASDLLVADLNFVAQQPVKLPPLMRG